jgi:branched-subunit amino acid ABC-type transport system permease component
MTHIILLGIVTGLGLGSIYALIALSYTLILAASGVFNFAQGSVVALGTLAAYYLGSVLHIPFVALVIASLGVGAMVGALTYTLAVQPFTKQLGNLTHLTLVSTVGLGLAFSAALSLAFGSDTHTVPSYAGNQPLLIAHLPIQPIYIVMFVTAGVISVGMDQVMARTKLGLVFRATVLDREGATLMGISSRRVAVSAFVVAGCMAALAGVLIAPATSASPSVGNDLALYGFTAMAFGGYGSFRGAILGGLAVGMVGGLVPVFTNPHLTTPIAFLLLLVVLVIKPVGLFGARGMLGAAAIREV